MLEQIPLMLATPIVAVVLDKFYEGIGSKLGEKAVEILPGKVKQLGQLIWEKCIQGNPAKDNLLERAAQGVPEEKAKLSEYINEQLDSDSELHEEVRKIAEEISLTIRNSYGDMIQNVSGGTGFQNRVEGGIVNQANNITQNYYANDEH